jgi:hypothetical protein
VKSNLYRERVYQWTIPKIVIVHLSSTQSVSSTYRPLIEPIDSNGLSLVVDDVDDVDDKKTLFSKEDEKFKIGDLVKPSDPYHERGQDLGIVEAG